MRNSSLFLFHKIINENTKMEEYETYPINIASIQSTKKISNNEEQDKSVNTNIWLFYKDIPNLDKIPICLGDIISKTENKEEGNIITQIEKNNYGSKNVNHIYLVLE